MRLSSSMTKLSFSRISCKPECNLKTSSFYHLDLDALKITSSSIPMGGFFMARKRAISKMKWRKW
jgi:hypothetical protein